MQDHGEVTLKNMPRPVHVFLISPVTRPGELAPAHAKQTDKPSIAILPFTNVSGDPDQEYFSDGITEDIITELSCFRDLQVIARNSSFQFRGKTVECQADRSRTGRTVLSGGQRASCR